MFSKVSIKNTVSQLSKSILAFSSVVMITSPFLSTTAFAQETSSSSVISSETSISANSSSSASTETSSQSTSSSSSTETRSEPNSSETSSKSTETKSESSSETTSSSTETKPLVTNPGTYKVTKISHDGKGGNLYIIKTDENNKEVKELITVPNSEKNNYNDIQDNIEIGNFQSGQELILEIYSFYRKQTIRSDTDLNTKVKVEKPNETTFKFSFEDWKDNDFNDLVLEVSRVEATQPDVKIPEKYRDLYEKVKKDGTVRVIASLKDVEFGSTQEIKQKTEQIKGDLGLEKVKEYRFVPAAAFAITPENSEKAFNNVNIENLEEDLSYEVELDTSNTVIQNDLVYNNTPANYRGRNTYIAVLDTGSDTDHPFLSNIDPVREACFSENVVGTSQSLCANGADFQFGPGSSEACIIASVGCDHGTHVAGISNGINNGTFYGVASESNLVSINVFGRRTNGETLAFNSDIVLGLEHVWDLKVNQNLNVVAANMSLGGSQIFNTNCNVGAFNIIMSNLRNAGVAPVAATGNDGSSVGINSPACVAEAVAVGATNDADVVAGFSNNGQSLDLYAPGVTIRSANVGGGYINRSGTSMATPHVSGAFAVLQEAHFETTGSYASVDTIEQALSSTGTPITRDGITRPRINVCLAAVSLGVNMSGCSLSGIEGTVFEDVNNNGLQEATEPTIANATVQLINPTNGAVISTSISEVNGSYQFLNLANGNYQIRFISPIGSSPSVFAGNLTADNNNDINDPSGLTPVFAFNGGIINYIDGGFVRLGRIETSVWREVNPVNNIQNFFEVGIPGIAVTLTDIAGNSVTAPGLVNPIATDALGAASFTNIPAGQYRLLYQTGPANILVDRVGVQSDDLNSDADPATGLTEVFTVSAGQLITNIDAGYYELSQIRGWVFEDVNNDGLRGGAAEVLLNGFTINLYEVVGGNRVFVSSTVTSNALNAQFADINYRFINLPVNRNYQVELVPNPSWVLTRKNIGGNNGIVDSDFDTLSYFSDVLTLPTNYIDAGLYQTTSIGDQVWLDQNNNGLQDATEPGFNGVTVELLDTAGNPVVDAGGLTVAPQVTSTVGGTDGFYRFERLVTGTYIVRFTLPNGESFTQTVGALTDANNNDATVLVNQLVAQTQPIAITAGQNFGYVDSGVAFNLPQADIQISNVVVSNLNPAPGEVVTITYTVTNNGPDFADLITPGYLGFTPVGFGSNLTEITNTISTGLASGQSGTVSFQITVGNQPTYPANYNYTIGAVPGIGANFNDPDIINNTQVLNFVIAPIACPAGTVLGSTIDASFGNSCVAQKECPTGGTLQNNGTCLQAGTTLTCPFGGNLVGNDCEATEAKPVNGPQACKAIPGGYPVYGLPPNQNIFQRCEKRYPNQNYLRTKFPYCMQTNSYTIPAVKANLEGRIVRNLILTPGCREAMWLRVIGNYSYPAVVTGLTPYPATCPAGNPATDAFNARYCRVP